MKKYIIYISVGLLLSIANAQDETIDKALNHDLELDIELENRYFLEARAFDGQKRYYPSLALRPKYTVEWKDGDHSLNVEGFVRFDRDGERTHFDFREFYYHKIKGNWELSIGLKKVFWGVTESNHLVDIINQTDAIESFDGEEKLGQPMVQFSIYTNWGTFDLFYLPFHRKRTLPGSIGRFRFPVIIKADEVLYESASKEWHQDLALRYANSINSVDLGLSYFYGTGREPFVQFDDQSGIMALYPVIHQFGLELQITNNAFMWKLESIYRSNALQKFVGLNTGFEYTISNIKSSGVDIGLILEYLYDDRGDLAFNALQNDCFMGSRIAFNDMQDTSILLGVISDLEKSSKIIGIEASRRLGSTMKLELEGRLFTSIAENEVFLSNFKKDSFLGLTLIKYF
ncbi:hypothetical protein [Aestuariivivens sediminicola]|uniref:hypothetical protein n=1 Tax=Aestuariivivens sediminicola TaxID=2913560 RepID=UPI001F588058|nr:hypothetical protein [Aestuariivivens sediminicola]